MTRNGGNMAYPGSVSYLFNRKDVLGIVLDPGAEDVNDLGGSCEVIPETDEPVAVRTALQEAGIDYDSDVNSVPTVQVELEQEGAKKIVKLVDALDDNDDMQNVFVNFDVATTRWRR